MFQREIAANLLHQLASSNKIVVLYGARQVGKTTLLKDLIQSFNGKSKWINGDIKSYQEVLSSQNLTLLKDLVDDADLLIIDEAQNIQDIGINLKILYDEMPNLKIISTGSSSLELANATQETLTGRTSTFKLFPISIG